MRNNLVKKTIAKMAYETSEKSANRTCIAWFYQPVLPEKVNQLKKHVK